MAAAGAEPAADAADAPPTLPRRLGKKKLILIGAVVLLVLAVAAAGTLFLVQQRRAVAAAAALAADGEASADAEEAWSSRRDRDRTPPTFVALEPFVVNLADRDVERFAQIGITLEVDETAFADEVRTWMPAIRNAILMILAHKTSRELTERAGKEALADEILLEALRTMGLAPPRPMLAGSDAEPARQEARRRPATPLRKVHFSSFLIQ